MTLTEITQSNWAQGFAYECQSALGKAIEYATNEDIFVISLKDDLDTPLWTITPASNNDFWMAAYDTVEQAVALCNSMGWKFVCE